MGGLAYQIRHLDRMQTHPLHSLYMAATPPRPRRRLTPRQRAVLKFVTEHPDATLEEIGIACGLSEEYPRQAAYDALNSKGVKSRMEMLMDARPALKDEALLVKLEEGLEAQETKFFAHEGEVVDERTTTDYPTRRGYLELALKLKGRMKEQREVSGPNGGPIPTAPAPLLAALSGMSKAELMAVVRATAA
jgi:signal recognition particle subunit SEC65